MYIIAGQFQKKRLETLKGLSTRPTTTRLREAVFNICQQSVGGASFLDLFAGVGAMGLEAISRGAKTATFVENSKKAHHLIKKNIENLGCETITHKMMNDVLKALENLLLEKKSFDIIFADPPYGLKDKGEFYANRLIEKIDQSTLLKEKGELFIEEGTDQLNTEYETLTLKKKRRFGSSYLYHFHKN